MICLLLLSLSLMLAIDKVHADTDSEFIRAALDETPDRAKVLFEEGANINASDENGQTALMMASNNGRFETVKFLIEHGADVNAIDKGGKTPLMYGARFDNCRVLKVLIEKGANVNAKDDGGWSPLIYAAYNSRDISERLLLRYGADSEYAIEYATEALTRPRIKDRSVYVGAATSVSGGYQRVVDINNSMWQRLKSYFDCILRGF